MAEDLSLPLWAKITGMILGPGGLVGAWAFFRKAKTANAEDRIDRLESRLKQMQAELTELRPEIESLGERMRANEIGTRDIRRELRDGLLDLKDTIERLVSQIQ